jgi:hypothetical protein
MNSCLYLVCDIKEISAELCNICYWCVWRLFSQGKSSVTCHDHWPVYSSSNSSGVPCERELIVSCEIVFLCVFCLVTSLTKLNSGASQKCVFEMSKRKRTYNYVSILIFWKCFESTEFNCILLLFISSWSLYYMHVFSNTLLTVWPNLHTLFWVMPPFFKGLLINWSSHDLSQDS